MSGCSAFDLLVRAAPPLAVGAAVAALATHALARLARERGWVDSHGGDPELAARKPRRTPVPLVGGGALALAWIALAPFGFLPEGFPWPAALAAFALGTLDDRLPRGLGWRSKLVLQAGVALLLAADGARGSLERLGIFAAALVGQNLANTFDNADGALAALAALSFRAQAALCGPLLGFLPANLFLRSGPERAPRAYLGDAGSHVLGVLWAANPTSWPVLLLPALDLARLSYVRMRLGRRPWQGDRRHLAHRLQAAGLRPAGVVLVLVGIALPSALVPLGSRLFWPGLALSGLAYALCVRASPDPDRVLGTEAGSGACPAEGPVR